MLFKQIRNMYLYIYKYQKNWVCAIFGQHINILPCWKEFKMNTVMILKAPTDRNIFVKESPSIQRNYLRLRSKINWDRKFSNTSKVQAILPFSTCSPQLLICALCSRTKYITTTIVTPLCYLTKYFALGSFASSINRGCTLIWLAYHLRQFHILSITAPTYMCVIINDLLKVNIFE